MEKLDDLKRQQQINSSSNFNRHFVSTWNIFLCINGTGLDTFEQLPRKKTSTTLIFIHVEYFICDSHRTITETEFSNSSVLCLISSWLEFWCLFFSLSLNCSSSRELKWKQSREILCNIKCPMCGFSMLVFIRFIFHRCDGCVRLPRFGFHQLYCLSLYVYVCVRINWAL